MKEKLLNKVEHTQTVYTNVVTQTCKVGRHLGSALQDCLDKYKVLSICFPSIIGK